jgi:transposase
VDRGDLEREQDIEELRRIALAQHAQLQLLMQLLEKQQRELGRARGSSGDLQLTLKMLEELKASASKTQAAIANADKKSKPERTPRTSTGPTEQPRLPVFEEVFALDTPDRTCTSCGGDLRPMDGQFDESEMIDVVEVSYRLVKVKQQKYVCRCGGCVETAVGPDRALPGSRYSLAFAIKVVLDKWLDHIPLERQVRIHDRYGLTTRSQTLWDLAYALAQRLSLVDAALFAHVKAQPVIGLDQTSWPRLEADATNPWQMWCLSAPGVVVHRIRDDKSAATFHQLVGDYTGTIVADALSTHEAGAREGPGIVLAGCWAHVFRYFEDAVRDHPAAARALEWIGALYTLDERGEGNLARIAELRRSEAPAILDAFRTWLLERAGDTHVSIGKSAAYTLGIWDRLTRFVDDARIPLDNNATERAIRGPVVGRKNHYGSKSRSGTQVASTFYTILETAKLHTIDPAAYLKAAVLAADRGDVLLPWHFAAQS